jgi:flavin reductase (DIM6/NTAB) family NADH-FMN oxidoreductase RutF
MIAAPISIDRRTFRATMGRFATGVTVISTAVADQVHAMTANAFMSVSLDPPLVAVSIGCGARMHGLLRHDAPLGISILAEDQAALSDHFAGRAAADVLPRWRWLDDVPLLHGTVAQVATRIVALHPAGDHTLVVGEVLHVAHDDRPPLVFHAGRYTQLS